jgi:hypothetical protein
VSKNKVKNKGSIAEVPCPHCNAAIDPDEVCCPNCAENPKTMIRESLYYIPRGVMRKWPQLATELRPLVGLKVAPVDSAEFFAPAVGYVPVYARPEDLIAEHGDVPYEVARR